MFTNSFMQDIEVNIYTFQQELVMIKESLKEQKEMIFNLQNYMQNMKLKFEHLEENVRENAKQLEEKCDNKKCKNMKNKLISFKEKVTLDIRVLESKDETISESLTELNTSKCPISECEKNRDKINNIEKQVKDLKDYKCSNDKCNDIQKNLLILEEEKATNKDINKMNETINNLFSQNSPNIESDEVLDFINIVNTTKCSKQTCDFMLKQLVYLNESIKDNLLLNKEIILKL